jgi:hypothetical protein
MAKTQGKHAREIWKEIPGYPGYEASNLGRVRSVDRWIKYRNNDQHFYRGNLLSSTSRPDGYLSVGVGLEKTELVHRLVALAFYGQPRLGQEVRHMNGKRDDNRIFNLRWGTRSQNRLDCIRHGTMNYGERNGQAILSEEDVINIRKSREPQSKIAAIYGVSQSTVSRVKTGYVWGWL